MRWAKWFGLVVAGLLLFVVIAIPLAVGIRPIVGPRAREVTDRRFQASPERVARGAYIATYVSGCLYCHSEIDWQAPGFPIKPGTEGAGRNWAEEGVPWISTPNLTPAGIGEVSDDTLARAIREGIARDGRALFPMMPYQHFRYMSDEDLASVIVFLRTLKPIASHPPASEIPFPLNRLINNVPQPVSEPVPQPDRGNRVAYGGYLVRIAVCRDCHTPMDAQGQSLTHLEFAGGNTFTGPFGSVASANITPAPSGIPYYDEGVFISMMRTGMVGARKIHDMMPWFMYGKQTDEDLAAIFAYLQTVKPVAHRVDNTRPASQCAVCGLSHGAGEDNASP